MLDCWRCERSRHDHGEDNACDGPWSMMTHTEVLTLIRHERRAREFINDSPSPFLDPSFWVDVTEGEKEIAVLAVENVCAER